MSKKKKCIFIKKNTYVLIKEYFIIKWILLCIYRSGENTTHVFKSASLAFIKIDAFSDFFKEIS